MDTHDNSSSNSLRTSQNSHAHPLSKSVFANLKHANGASREHVLNKALKLVGLPDNARAQVCIVALRACAEAIGKTPAWRDYEMWRLAQPNPELLPKRGYIANTFGSWDKALAWIDGEFVPDLRWNGRGAAGIGFTQAQVIASINEWLCELTASMTESGLVLAHPQVPFRSRTSTIGSPPMKPYFRWARFKDDGKCRASTHSVIKRLFDGDWDAAVQQALELGGLGDDVELLIRLSYMPAEELKDLSLVLLRECGKALGAKLSRERYDGWLSKTDADRTGEHQLLGRILRSARLLVIHRTWQNAVHQATGVPLSELSGSGRGAVTQESACAAIRLVAERLGRVPRSGEYEREREAMGRSIPYSRTIVRIFGSWEKAIEAAFGGAA